MTKKIIFTILWMVVFKMVFFILSAWLVLLLDRTLFHNTPPGTRPSHGAVRFMMGWIGLFKLSPWIALVLSMYGLLPGTKINANKKELEKVDSSG